MNQEKPKGPCGVCGGDFDEHEGKAHVWSQDGRLETPEEQAKRLRGVTIQAGVVSPPPPHPPGGENSTTRLAEVLAHRGLLDEKELLYVAGLGIAPWNIGVK